MSSTRNFDIGPDVKNTAGNGSSENSDEGFWRAWWGENKTRILLSLFGLLFVLVYFAPRIFISVHSGEAAVLWKRFGQGTITNWVYGEGLHIIPPWDKMTIYDVRIQHKEQAFDVISTNGLTISVEVSVRCRPKLPLLGLLHQEVGPDYIGKIVVPEVQALLRDLYGQYTPEEIYTTKRSLIQDSLSRAVGEIGERFVTVDDLLIKGIQLPAALREAIEIKLTQEQRQLEMRFRIGREELEVDRKLIEALGISGYNQIVANSLTDSLLTFKGIDASLELAKSTNAKIVIFGNKEGLPIILDSRLPDATTPTPTVAPTNQVLLPPLSETTVTNAHFPEAEKFVPRVRAWIRESTNSFNSLLKSIRRPAH